MLKIALCDDDASRRLGGHRHKGKLIGIHRLLEDHRADLSIVVLSLHMTTGSVLAAADGAHRLRHGAAHGNLLLDARLDVRNQLVILAAPADVGPGPDIACVLFLHYLGLENPGYLIFRAPPVIQNSRFPEEQLGKPGQCPGVEPLPVPVNPVVAQPQEPAMGRICRMFLALEGLDDRVTIEWDDISLQDITQEAQAELYRAQAEHYRRKD